MKNLSAIVAVNKLGYIGLNGELPWYSRDDLKYFKKQTIGKNLIVGSVTYKKLPPLPERNILIYGKDYLGFDDIINMVEKIDHEEFMVIGGRKTYEKFLPYISTFFISRINDYTKGDTKFELDELINAFGIMVVENNFNIN